MHKYCYLSATTTTKSRVILFVMDKETTVRCKYILLYLVMYINMYTYYIHNVSQSLAIPLCLHNSVDVQGFYFPFFPC